MHTRFPIMKHRLLSGDGLRAFLIRGFLGSGGLKVAHAFISLGVTIVLARALEPNGYGIYAFAFSLASLLAIPAQMGLPTLMVREVARYQLKEEWGYLNGIQRRANQAVIAFTIILLLCAGVVTSVLANELDEEKRATIIWALVLVPLIALGNLRGAALRGLRKVVQGQIPEMLLRPALLFVFAALMLWYGQLAPSDAMALHVLAAGIAFIVGFLLLRHAMPYQALVASPNYETREWVRSVIPLSFISGMQVINSQADIIMLGLLTTTQDVGTYRVVVQGASLVAFSLTAVNMVIAPQITRFYQAGELVKLQRMVTVSARFILAISVPFAAILIVFGAPILQVVFGDEYTKGHIALAILCLGQIVNAGLGSVGDLLNMTGHERDTAKGMMLAASSNIVLNMALIPKFGIEGAATATALTLAVWNVVLYRQVKVRIGIDSSAIPLLRRKYCI